MSITRGIDLLRNGKPVSTSSYVAWKNWVFDAWVSEYLLQVRQLPFAYEKDQPTTVCKVPKQVLLDMANILERKQFEICPRMDSYYFDDEEEQSYGARYGMLLRELAIQYQEGDELHYYNAD